MRRVSQVHHWWRMRTIVALAALGFAACHRGSNVASDEQRSLSGAERDELLAKFGLTADERSRTVAAFTLNEAFSGDFGLETELPVELAGGLPGIDNELQDVVLMLARAEELGDGSDLTRPHLVAPVVLRSAAAQRRGESMLVARGDLIAPLLDEELRIDRVRNNQAGTYILIAPPRGDAFQMVSGVVSTVSAGPGFYKNPWPGATIATTAAPVLARSGLMGKFVQVASARASSMLSASRTSNEENLGADLPATTMGAARVVWPVGARQLTESRLQQRLERFGHPDKSVEIQRSYADVFGNESSLLDGLALVDVDLLFETPKYGAAFQLSDERDPPARPTPDVLAEDLPPRGHPTLRVDSQDAPQLDLGCSGFDGAGESLELVRSGGKIARGQRGWRARGDARYAYDFAAEIFGAPEVLGSQYLDNLPGYCVMTTGEGQAARAYGDHVYIPGPMGRRLAADIAQPVLVPQLAKSVQVRAAVLTQEDPRTMLGGVTDAIYMQLDESFRPAVHVSLAELAAAGAFTALKAPMHGNLWDVRRSPSAAPGGFTAFMAPRLFCFDLVSGVEAGRQMTLRIGVTDGGDRLFDTAMLVDSVVFGAAPCSHAGARMTSESMVILH